jgi:hypothetical protein
MNNIQTLKVQDLCELRSLKKPPKIVKLVMKILCLFLGVEPVPKRCEQTGQIKLSYWKAAIGKDILANPRLQ